MDVKQAVARAKAHIAELFAEEGVKNLGLEEVEFDESGGVWNVTIGFSRPWDEPRDIAAIAKGQASRAYKVVRIADSDGKILSVKSHKVTA